MILTVDNLTTKVSLEAADKLREDINVLTELKDYLSVRVENYQHTQAYKRYHWDGYKSVFVYSKFPTGLLSHVLPFLKELNVKYTLIDMRINLPKFKKTKVSKIGDLELRDYQMMFIQKTEEQFVDNLWFPRGIADAATNAGKNLIIAGLYANIEEPKLLFLIHSKKIFNQAIEYFRPYFKVGQIGEGVYDVQDFTIAMYKTLGNRIKDTEGVQEQMNRFNILIVDECHRAGADDYTDTIKYINAGVRLFVSGTPLDMPKAFDKITVLGLSGPVLGKVENKELIERGISRTPTVYLHYNSCSKESKWILGATNFNDIQTAFIHESQERCDEIIKTLREDKKITLVAFQIISHGAFLYESIRDAFPDLRVEFSHGQDPDADWKLRDFGLGLIDVLICSSILKEGLNLPAIQSIWLCMGGLSKITVKQLVGRALRANGQFGVDVHDFYDDYKDIEEHSRKRARIYIAEGFKVIPLYKASRGHIPK